MSTRVQFKRLCFSKEGKSGFIIFIQACTGVQEHNKARCFKICCFAVMMIANDSRTTTRGA